MKKKTNKIIIAAVVFAVIVSIIIFICLKYLKDNEVKYSFERSTIIYYTDEREIEGNEIEYESYNLFVDYDNEMECIENEFLKSYKDFKEYIIKYQKLAIEEKPILDFFDEDFFEKYSLAVEVHDSFNGSDTYSTKSVKVDKNNVNISIEHKSYTNGYPLKNHATFEFIVLDKNTEHVNFYIQTQNIDNREDHFASFKPIIYLYPEYNMNVSVKLRYKENITVSYPKYINGWEVYAQTNGTLTDLNTNRNLYALYYENNNIVDFSKSTEGFVVKKEDLIEFLEEKLKILGLNEREMQEFIIYWLPKLEENEYNYIRFATIDEINKNMPIDIKPHPDTFIRILMVFKGLDKQIEVKEQKLTTPIRNGFTAVEWGGTEVK